MTDISFPMSPYAVEHKRPRAGISNRNTVRVYNSQPRQVSLQIRDAHGYSTAILHIEQVHALIDALNEACSETFPPLSPEDLLTIIKEESAQ
jgi:hypothetical protein